MIHIHCIAHKLELAVLDACKQVVYVHKLQTTIKSLLKYYSNSSERLNELAEAGTQPPQSETDYDDSCDIETDNETDECEVNSSDLEFERFSDNDV